MRGRVSGNKEEEGALQLRQTDLGSARSLAGQVGTQGFVLAAVARPDGWLHALQSLPEVRHRDACCRAGLRRSICASRLPCPPRRRRFLCRHPAIDVNATHPPSERCESSMSSSSTAACANCKQVIVRHRSLVHPRGRRNKHGV